MSLLSCHVKLLSAPWSLSILTENRENASVALSNDSTCNLFKEKKRKEDKTCCCFAGVYSSTEGSMQVDFNFENNFWEITKRKIYF